MTRDTTRGPARSGQFTQVVPQHVGANITMSNQRDDWERLADYVISRRGELGLSQRALAQTARMHNVKGLSIRTINDIENARKTTYHASTYAALERLLGWAPGSVRRILAGEENDDNPYVDPVERALWNLTQLSPDERRLWITLLRERLRNVG